MKVTSYVALTWHSFRDLCATTTTAWYLPFLLRESENLPFLLCLLPHDFNISLLTAEAGPLQLKQNKKSFVFHLEVFAVSSPNPKPLKEQELLPRDIPVEGLCLWPGLAPVLFLALPKASKSGR